MLWKKDIKCEFFTSNNKTDRCSSSFYRITPSFGVKQGDATRFEFGASISAYYKFNIMTNVSIENRLNLYSNYLDKPQNVDIDYQMNIIMKINKYMSANVAVQAIYDDNSIQAVQVREVFGLELTTVLIIVLLYQKSLLK
jgi:hypothetical protein